MFLESIEEHGDEFDARTGAEAVARAPAHVVDLAAKVVKVRRTRRRRVRDQDQAPVEAP